MLVGWQSSCANSRSCIWMQLMVVNDLMLSIVVAFGCQLQTLMNSPTFVEGWERTRFCLTYQSSQLKAKCVMINGEMCYVIFEPEIMSRNFYVAVWVCVCLNHVQMDAWVWLRDRHSLGWHASKVTVLTESTIMTVERMWSLLLSTNSKQITVNHI